MPTARKPAVNDPMMDIDPLVAKRRFERVMDRIIKDCSGTDLIRLAKQSWGEPGISQTLRARLGKEKASIPLLKSVLHPDVLWEEAFDNRDVISLLSLLERPDVGGKNLTDTVRFACSLNVWSIQAAQLDDRDPKLKTPQIERRPHEVAAEELLMFKALFHPSAGAYRIVEYLSRGELVPAESIQLANLLGALTSNNRSVLNALAGEPDPDIKIAVLANPATDPAARDLIEREIDNRYGFDWRKQVQAVTHYMSIVRSDLNATSGELTEEELECRDERDLAKLQRIIYDIDLRPTKRMLALDAAMSLLELQVGAKYNSPEGPEPERPPVDKTQGVVLGP